MHTRHRLHAVMKGPDTHVSRDAVVSMVGCDFTYTDANRPIYLSIYLYTYIDHARRRRRPRAPERPSDDGRATTRCAHRRARGRTRVDDGIHRARDVVVDDDDDAECEGDIVAGGDAGETRAEAGACGEVFGVVVGGVVFGVVVGVVGVARVWHGIERCVRCARRELARGEVLCERRREPMDDVVHWGVGGRRHGDWFGDVCGWY